jgi:hypothetical protein
MFTLTTGVDTFVGGPGANTVYGTAATLNAGDSLTGGTGSNVLQLIGSGTFDVSQLASFTGVWSINLDNPTTGGASLVLGNQPVEVDVTGQLYIGVSSPSNWNGSDIVNGDSSHTWPTTNISFTNYQYPQQPLTYDLTSNSFSHVSIQGGGNDLTLLINNADTAGVQSFYGYGTNDELVTAGSTLDLSHSTVSGFRVVSSNPFGTTFTVGDLGTAFQIAGGPRHDTIQTSAFTFTADQRNTIFATASIETIIDPSGTYTASFKNEPPATPATPADSAVVNGYVNAAHDTANQALTGSAENGSTVTIYDNGTQVGTATADAVTGAWSFPIGQLADATTHNYTVTATDAAGNVSQPSAALNFLVDTTAPTVTIAGTGGLTNHVTQAVSGTVDFADAGSTVILLDGGSQVGAATGQSDGTWATQVSLTGDGVHTLFATETDAAGNLGTSNAIAYTLDTTSPNLTISQTLAHDTGIAQTDWITNDGHVTLSGTVSDANGVAGVEVFDGTADLGPATITNGAWAFSTVLAEGTHTLDAVATDDAGNTTTTPSQPTVVVATTPPIVTVSQSLVNDTGVSHADLITNDGHVTLSGMVSDDNGVANVEVFDGKNDLGPATISGGGWAFSTVLQEGTYSLYAITTDDAGNTTQTATQPTIIVDQTPPTPFMSDAVKNASLTTLSGMSEGNSTVFVFDGTNSLGTVTADNIGNWSLQANITGSTHQFTETATDVAGNTGPSAGVTVFSQSAGKTLVGGSGNDFLIAGSNDTLTGGAGSDTFVFNANFGKNVVSDFDVTQDNLAFSHTLFANDTIAQVLSQTHDTSAGAVITMDSHDTITLHNVTTSQLAAHSSDFHFF